MKRLILVAMLLLMPMIAGCGSEMSVALPIVFYDSPPTVTTYRHTQDVVNSYVDGTVEFYAPDNDIATVKIAGYM